MEFKKILLFACIFSLSLNTANADIIENKIYTGLVNKDAQANGGAMHIYGNDVTTEINNSVFNNNNAQGSMYSLGGALFVSNKSTTINDSTFKGNFADKATDGNNGGAIFADGGSIKENTTLTINNSKFTNNYAADNNMVPFSGSAFAGGGAISIQNYNQININNCDFTGNYVKGNTTYILGGAISPTFLLSQIGTTYSKTQNLNITNTQFINNYISNDQAGFGGAIGSLDKINLNIDSSLFQGNSIISGSGNRGGAIYVQESNVTINNTDFIENSITSGTNSYGGAIFGFAGNITLKNSSFINNSTTGAGGGAIFYQGNGASKIGTVNIIADGKNVEFTGNKANNASDAIYASSNSRLNLNASTGNKIIFNDRIYLASNNGILNINNPNSYTENNSLGEVIFNASMARVFGEVNLYGGTLKIGENGTFVNGASKFTSYDGATIDFQNNKIDSSTIKNLVLNGTTNLKIDADLANNAIDSFTVNSASGNGSFKITGIDIYSAASTDGSFTKDIITGAGTGNVTTILDSSLYTILTQENKYNVTLSDNKLSFDQSAYGDGINGAVHYTDSDSRQFHMNSDEIVTNWDNASGAIEGKELVIKGNQNSVIGQAVEGISLNNDQNLTIANIGSESTSNAWSGFESQNGGAINNSGGTATIIDSVFANNTASENGGAIFNDNGTINIVADNSNVIFENNKAGEISNAIHTNGGNINLNASAEKGIIFNDTITSTDTSSVININASKSEDPAIIDNVPNNGIVVLNNDMSGYKGDVNLYHGTIKVGKDGTFFGVNNFNIHGCTLDFGNGVIQNYNLGNLTISDKVFVAIDADLANNSIDTISSSNKISDQGKIDINSINLLSDAATDRTSLNFADSNLKDSIIYSGSDISYSPIFKYNVNYDPNSGNFNFNRYGGNNYNSYNPSVFAAPVAAQLGGYLSQLNSYDQAFMNLDMRMLMPKELREAMKYKNKYASAGNSPMVYSPLLSQNQKTGEWVRPYATFENVSLKGGPRVSNVMYGTFMGVDSEMKELGHGFDGQFSVYAGYNGSHQVFNGISMYQNGGNLGFTGAVYKGNFFSALTANAGASAVDANTMYGNETFPMLMAGAASKTGYNWELAKGKLIIQPSYMMSYTFVNVFNYNNASGLDVNSDPLNAIQISPGIKLIGNLKNGWQPYIGVNMVWNIMDKTKFTIEDVSLPELSVRPYVEYGIGVQKLWGDRFTGFVQTMFRNGGRNGVALSFGLRWSIGKAPESKKSDYKPAREIKQTTKIDLQCNRKT